MKIFFINRIWFLIILLAFLSGPLGCAYRTKSVGPTAIEVVQGKIPEEALMDVGIAPFDSDTLSPKEAQKEGTNADIRKAEGLFIPYHLKNTLQKSGQWGAVRVVPEDAIVDLQVKGKIEKSDGEYLILKIDVVDATGKTWFKKRYKAEADETAYSNPVVGEKDAFQDLYNTVANDIAEFRQELTMEEIETIRTVAKLKFAQQMAPDAFDPYLEEDKKGRVQLNRVPADNDPMMARVLKIRQRDAMYLDTLNKLYDGFYNDMWTSYQDWRYNNLTERTALRKIKRDAWLRGILGAMLIAGAIATEAADVDNVSILQGVMVAAGGMLIVNGINVSQQKEIHAVAIKELSYSFGDTMRPIVMNLEGEQIKLSGPVKEQYAKWQAILRNIYLQETGYDSTVPPSGEGIPSEPELGLEPESAPEIEPLDNGIIDKESSETLIDREFQ